MKKLVIPLLIPLIKNEVDYELLTKLVKDIEDCNILIGDYGLNDLEETEYIKVYLYLNVINSNNKYYIEKNNNDILIQNYKKDNNKYVVSKLGNILSNEIKEYLQNEENGVIDKTLNQYLLMFKKIINDDKDKIKYILERKVKGKDKIIKQIDNLLGINEI